MKFKILVSACLMGENVRYDGRNFWVESPFLSMLKKEGHIVSLCPEVLGGGTIPRLPAELNSEGEVWNNQGEIVTKMFHAGAKEVMKTVKEMGIKVALLKDKSPSCGPRFIYSGHFENQLIEGEGITAQILKKHGLTIFTENELDEFESYVRGLYY